MLMECQLLREDEVAGLIGYSVHTLRQWRAAGGSNRGPAWVKNGRAVRYRRSDVETWLNSLPEGGDQEVDTGD